jgi:hypothetical protein
MSQPFWANAPQRSDLEAMMRQAYLNLDAPATRR